MALEGSLREFNVADILQLIFFQKKTGVLMLSSRSDRVRVLFFDGNIVGAESKKRGFERKLGMILMKKGLISKEQIESTIEKQRAEGGKFGAVLVKEGHITKEQLQEVITFQITEVMVTVFSMQEGFYEFKPQSVPVDKEVGVVLNTEHFLMEGVRLVDEWTEIEGKIDLDDLYYKVDPAPRVKLTEKEQKVLALVDGQHIVADVTDISGIDSFTVSSTILELAEKGVLKKYVPEEEPQEEPPPPVKDIPALKPILYLLIILSMAVSILMARGSALDDYYVFKASEQIDALKFQVETQYYIDGAYPQRIDAVDPWGISCLYEVRGNSYLLMSAGPDGYLGTPDDIPGIYNYFVNDSGTPAVSGTDQPQ